MSASEHRAAREVEHGKYLAERDPELVWGWGTPAGRVRAMRRAELILAGAEVDGDSRILEVGCGSGLFTQVFAGSGAEVVAVDLSAELLGIARGRGLPADRVQFLEKPFEECEPEGPFDAVVGSSILHHLDLLPSLSKVFDLLKPGGRMSFAEPNMLNPQVFLERRFRRFFPYVSPDETAFVASSLARDLGVASFDSIAIEPFDWLHPSVPRALIPTVSRLGMLLERTWGVRRFAGSLQIRARRPHTGDRGAPVGLRPS